MRLLLPFGLALVALVAVAVVACGGRGIEDRPTGPGDRPPAPVDVQDIVAVPERWFREPVRVTGRAVPIDAERFVLRGAGRAIVVVPEPAAMRGRVEPGERVTVTGYVSGFNRLQAAELERLLRSSSTPAALRQAPTELEGVYISADRVRASG